MSDGLTTGIQILDTLEAIDAAWLDRMFAKAGVAAPPVAVVSFEPVGNGTTSQVARLAVTFQGDPGDAPRTLIAKFPKAAANGVAPDPEIFGYEREVAAYRFFGPSPPFRIPRAYLAQSRPDGAFNLVLEDLDDGCRPGDQITGCSVTEAEAVVRELAALHAFAWKQPVLADLTWPRRRAPLAARSALMFARGATVMRERHAKALGKAAMAVIEAAAPLVGPWSAVAADLSLIHTDPRVDNVIFETTPDGTRACLIDLQSVAVGDPAYDLAYFLSGSLDPADRAACERRLVGAHAAALMAAGADWDAETAWESYRQNSLGGLVATVSAAGLLRDQPRVDRLIETLASRNCAAVLTLGGLAAAQRRIGATVTGDAHRPRSG